LDISPFLNHHRHRHHHHHRNKKNNMTANHHHSASSSSMPHGNNDTADSMQRRQVLKRLYTATILCTCFLVVEVTGGLISGSLAILSDAAHLFADLASFAVASK
jgi:Co/Zn/Cd efflux system component